MQSSGAVAPPPAAVDDDVERIVTLYRTAWGQLRATDPQVWAGGLSMPQIRVLFFLNRSGPSAVGEVAAGVGVSQPSATETLDRLVRAGLVKRKVDPADRRVVRNKLTAAGRAMVERPWEMRRAVLARALRDVPEASRAAIVDGLELLCSALEVAQGEPVEREPEPERGRERGREREGNVKERAKT